MNTHNLKRLWERPLLFPSLLILTIAASPAQTPTLTWNAADNLDGDNLWPAEQDTFSAWEFPDPPMVGFGATDFPKAPAWFRSPSATQASLDGLGGTNFNVSWELVFRPGDLEGNHVIFETGGNGDGTGFVLSDGNLEFRVQDANSEAQRVQLVHPLSPGDEGRFHHVVATVTLGFAGDSSVSLYVNGGPAVATAGASGDLNDWAGGDGAAIGRLNGSVPAGLPGATPFTGDLALLNYYENTVLTPTQVQERFDDLSTDDGTFDADSDGLPDLWEEFYFNNLDAEAGSDDDGDGLTNEEELEAQTDPTNDDTDQDGSLDGAEMVAGTDPANPDSDNDGLLDGVESNTGTFVDANDTGTDPLDPDSDGDGFDDGLEVLFGNSDPLEAISRPLRSGLLDILAFWDFNDASDPDATIDQISGLRGDFKPGTLYSGDGTGRSGEAGDRALDLGPTGQVGTGVIVEQGRFLNLAGLQNQIGISVWVNVPSFQASMTLYANSSDIERALSAHAPWSNGQLYWDTAGCCNGATQRINAPGGLIENTWYHVVFNKNGDNKEIWVDGNLILSGVNTADLPTTFTRFFIGTDPNALNAIGLIDDMAVFADALSSEEIAALAAGEDPRSLVPSNEDADRDGLPDAWETANGLNPAVDDAGDDLDGDGLSNLDEYLMGTDPNDDDSDDDGLLDGVENNSGTFVSSTQTGTDPLNPDSDGDGLLDGVESGSGSFVGASDTGTDPTLVDSDGDGYDDGLEVSEGSDPTDPNDFPAIPEVTIIEGLLGGDLTDPEDDGIDIEGAGFDPAANNWNFVSIDANDEPDFQGGEFAFNIFDNQVGGGNAKWCCNPPSPELTVTVEFEEEYSLTHFTITSGNDTPSRDPLTFFIEGSNDGVTFETIYERDDDTAIWTARNQTARVDLPSPADPYRFFRYRVTRTGGTAHQINEIEYFGEPGIVGPPVITDFSYDPETAQVTLTWNSRDNREYSVFASTDLLVFDQEITDGFASQGDQTTFSFQNFTPEFETLFFRVVENE